MINKPIPVLMAVVSIWAVACTSNSTTTTTVVKKAVVTKTADSLQTAATTKDTAHQAISDPWIMPDVAGYYKAEVLEGDDGEACDISVKITKVNGVYFYKFSVNGNVKRGKVKVSKSDDNAPGVCVVSLKGIPWASYEGDVSQRDEDDTKESSIKLPVDIDGLYQNNEITFQNYGNAMNSYTVISECESKFIRLVKQR